MTPGISETPTWITPPAFGWWHRRVHPHLLDRFMATEETTAMRARVCAPLEGDVLEVGFGTGLNLLHLPASVRTVFAVEPLERAWGLAHERIDDVHAEVTRVSFDARSIPFHDQSVDAALCTWSLCSIDEPEKAIREIARVLRPGGELHFVEHGRSNDERVSRWQRRGDPVWSHLSCGCHLDRDIASIVERGGMEVTELHTYYTESEPKFLGWTFEGRARAA